MPHGCHYRSLNQPHCFVFNLEPPANDPPTNLRKLSRVGRVLSSSCIVYHLSHHFPSSSYYTKRVYGTYGDTRLAILPRDLFKERRVLDIGCNEGVVTIEIGVFLNLSRSRLAQNSRAEPFSPIYIY